MVRILVVDDQEDARDLTEGALLSAGYTDLVTAESGWGALKMLDVGGTAEETAPVDLVLLDIVMPEMDGVEACARIRNDERYADMPIIMVTSLDDADSLANAFVAGATDYITKPVNRVELVARVRSALRLKQELDRRQARERELLAFLSNWGDRRAGLLIDETTGLFVGEAAEAYLTALRNGQHDEVISILALSLDRFDIYRAANGEDAAQTVLAEVSRAVRRLAATVGIVAAAYRNGIIILVAPEVDSKSARALGETLRTAVSKLRLRNSESVVSDYVTASVAAITGKAKQAVDRIHLLTHAIAKVQDAAGSGGDRVLAFTL
jgi:sigma-B regulation protein RsbU (phosphoserine phosphatase)